MLGFTNIRENIQKVWDKSFSSFPHLILHIKNLRSTGVSVKSKRTWRQYFYCSELLVCYCSTIATNQSSVYSCLKPNIKSVIESKCESNFKGEWHKQDNYIKLL